LGGRTYIQVNCTVIAGSTEGNSRVVSGNHRLKSYLEAGSQTEKGRRAGSVHQ